jgi:uncharacterized membrane protein
MEQNPYAPPGNDLELPREQSDDEGFIEGGRGVEAGQGWQWFAGGWELFKQSPGIWIVICILYMFIAIAVSLVPFVGQFAFAMLSPVLSAGLLLGCRDLREGRELGASHLFEGFKYAGGLMLLGVFNMVWTAVLGGVGVLLGAGGAFMPQPKFILAGGGDPFAAFASLMTFAGVAFVLGIPVAMANYYAPALVALKGMPPLQALKNSFFAATKNVLPFIVYIMLAFIFAIPAALPCGLGFFVYVPVMIASVYVGYRDVFYAAPRVE